MSSIISCLISCCVILVTQTEEDCVIKVGGHPSTYLSEISSWPRDSIILVLETCSSLSWREAIEVLTRFPCMQHWLKNNRGIFWLSEIERDFLVAMRSVEGESKLFMSHDVFWSTIPDQQVSFLRIPLYSLWYASRLHLESLVYKSSL